MNKSQRSLAARILGSAKTKKKADAARKNGRRPKTVRRIDATALLLL